MTKKTTSTASGSSLVRELADILDDAGLVELEYATDDVNIRLSRASGAAVAPVMTAPVAAAAPAASAPATPAEAAAEANHPGAVPSPMVGTAYLAPEPGADDFVKVGDSVKAGQTIVIIEAMKVMNPITAPAAGVVRAILIENAQPIEFGQALVVID